MELINLHARALSGCAQVWWEDADGFRYRLTLAYDHAAKDTARPLTVITERKGYYSDGPDGQWVVKLPALEDARRHGSRVQSVYMDATNKRWAPVVAEALRRVDEGDLIAKAREEARLADEARTEMERSSRAEKIKNGIDDLAEKTEDGWFRKALIDLSLHATRDDLFRLQNAVRQ